MIKNINWLFVVAGTFIMMYVMFTTGKTLSIPSATPHGIIHLELAYNSNKTKAVLNAWMPDSSNGIDNIKVAIKNTWLDFIFIFFYSLFLFYSCKKIAESFTGFTYKLGIFLAMGALNAGMLDIAENAGMLLSLNGFFSNSISFFTAICSVIKWALALSALLYVLLAGPFFLFRQSKGK